MCGILALLCTNNQKPQQGPLDLHLKLLNHRGPDSFGSFSNQYTYIGSTRLSHRDLRTRANLPLIDSQTGNVLAFNGELVNDEILRSQLIGLGHHFETKSDSEVILKGYEHWGVEIFSKIRGMFAIVIWNEKKKKLVVARDWFGIKPLFYLKSEMGHLFSSEIKGLAPFKQLDLNEERLSEYLTFGYVAQPETLFKEIRHFPKGYFSEIDIHTECLKFHKIIPSQSNETLEDVLSRNIFGYCKSDRKIGLQLSGGIDSTFVLKYASEHLKGIVSFGVDVPDSINSELEFQIQASRQFHSTHSIVKAENQLFLENLESTTIALEVPIHHHANVYLYLLMKEASQTCQGLLTGEGGDEFFLGYPRYQIDQQRIERIFLENKNLSSRMQRCYPLLRQLYLSPERIQRLAPEIEKYYPERSRLLFENDGSRFIHHLIEHDRDQGLDSLLLRQDRLGMHFSLENRPPFIDPDIESLLNRSSVDERMGKTYLKNDLALQMGIEFVNRKKKGFGIPLFEILNFPTGKKMIEERIVKSDRLKNYINQKGIEFELNRFNHRDLESSKYLMRLIYLDTWIEQVLQPYQSSFQSY